MGGRGGRGGVGAQGHLLSPFLSRVGHYIAAGGPGGGRSGELQNDMSEFIILRCMLCGLSPEPRVSFFILSLSHLILENLPNLL